MSSASDYARLISNDVDVEEKLNIIERGVRNRLAVLLGLDSANVIPDKFNYIVDDIVAARFNRIGNESMKQVNQDGLSMVFVDDDFAKYDKEIAEFKNGSVTGPRSGKVYFL